MNTQYCDTQHTVEQEHFSIEGLVMLSKISDFVDQKLKRKKDPCQNALDSYLRCVDSHTDGLTEGDDCKDETKVYKQCRLDNKVSKAK